MKEDANRELAKLEFLNGNNINEIAVKCGVSRRTISRWISEGNWHELKSKLSPQISGNPGNVVPIGSKKSTPRLRERKTPPKAPYTLNDASTLTEVINDLFEAFQEANDRTMPQLAICIAKLMEIRRKLSPEGPAEIVERLIELGITPDVFMSELKRTWANRQ